MARSTFPSQMLKHTRFGALLGVEMSKKCTPLWHEAHFQVKMLKTHVRTTFGRSDVVSRGQRKGWCTLSKLSKTWGFPSMSKNDGRCGTFQEDLERCIFPGRRSTKRHVHQRCYIRGQGADFLVAFWSIRSSGLLRWFCMTGATLHMTWPDFFVADAVL